MATTIQHPVGAAAIATESTLHALRKLAGKYATKLPDIDATIPTVVTDSDLSRWSTSLEAIDCPVSFADRDVASVVLPEVREASAEGNTVPVSHLCPIPPFDATLNLGKTNSKQIMHRTKWLPYRQKIVAYTMRNDILSSLRERPFLFVIGGPRTGKSTQVPQLLAETELFRKKRILVVTATARAAVALAQRIREEKGDSQPIVAHSVPMSSRCTSATHIAVCSYEICFKLLLADPLLRGVGCVILDDLHCHCDVYRDLCISALRDLVTHPTSTSDLKMVFNCRDDATEGSLAQYFASVGGKIGKVALADAGSASQPAMMFLDDAYQWLERTAQSGQASLVADPTVELAGFVTNVQVVAKVLAADELDVASASLVGVTDTSTAPLVTFWLPLVRSLLTTFDTAERNALMAVESATLSAVLIIAPSAAVCRSVQSFLLSTAAESAKLDVRVLCSAVSASSVLDQLTSLFGPPPSRDTRRVFVATPLEVLCTSLFPVKDVGCLIDLCRQERCFYDSSLEAERVSVDYVSRSTIRAHRLTVTQPVNGITPMSLQLLSRQTLHSQRTKLANPHPFTVASLNELLDTVSYLCSRSPGPSLSARFAKVAAGKLIDVPQSHMRSDSLARSVAQVENLLQRLGHADHELRLTPLGCAAVLMPLTHCLNRLLLFGSVLSDLVYCSLVAAILLVGDPFRGTLANPATAEAKQFFVMGEKCPNDISVIVNAFVMWRRTVAQVPDEESDVIETASLDRLRLQQILAMQEEILSTLAALQVVSAAPTTPDMDAEYCKQDTSASAVSFITSSCITAAFYPQVVYHLATLGHVLVPKLETSVPCVAQVPSLLSPQCVAPSAETVLLVAASKQASPAASFVELAHCYPANLPAMVMFCGQGSRVVLPAANRCRGWGSALTNAWRLTKAASHLPPPPQIPLRAVPVKPYVPNATDLVRLDLDCVASVKTYSSTATLLAKFREYAKKKLLALVLGAQPGSASQNSLRDAIEWLDVRQRDQANFLRDRRQHTRNERPPPTPYLSMATNYERPTLIASVAQASAQHALAASRTTAAEDEPSIPVASATAAAALTFSGLTPSNPTVVALIRQTAQTIARNSNRDSEGKILSSSPTVFAFLNPEHEHHEYYLHVLKQEAPHLDWLGDDLTELETWLQDLETQVERELGGYAEGDSDPSQASGVPQHQPSGNAANGYTAAAIYAAQQYEELTEEEYLAELKRQQDEADEEARRLEEARRAAEPPPPPPPAAEPLAKPSIPPQLQHPPRSTNHPPTATTSGAPTPAAAAAAPSATMQFIAPTASFAGVGSGAVGGNSLLQSLMAMRNNANSAAQTGATGQPQPDTSAAGPVIAPGPVAHTSSLVFGKVPIKIPLVIGNLPIVPPPPLPIPPPLPPPDEFLEPMTAAEMLEIIGAVPSTAVSLTPAAAAPPPPPPTKPHPLSIPPPPLPNEALANRSPSVIVSPLPKMQGVNLPLVLAKALGETLDKKCGPTLIVGEVARIEVPSLAVEQRAIALKHFFCLGEKLTITKNDRIVDNPNAVHSNNRIQGIRDRLNPTSHPPRPGAVQPAAPAPASSFSRKPMESQETQPQAAGLGDRPAAMRFSGNRPGDFRGGPKVTVGVSGGLKPVTSFVTSTIGSGYLRPPPSVVSPVASTAEDVRANDASQTQEQGQAEQPVPSPQNQDHEEGAAAVQRTGALTDSDEEE